MQFCVFRWRISQKIKQLYKAVNPRSRKRIKNDNIMTKDEALSILLEIRGYLMTWDYNATLEVLQERIKLANELKTTI